MAWLQRQSQNLRLCDGGEWSVGWQVLENCFGVGDCIGFCAGGSGVQRLLVGVHGIFNGDDSIGGSAIEFIESLLHVGKHGFIGFA